MAKKISDLDLKASPAAADIVEIETAAGAGARATVASLMDGMPDADVSSRGILAVADKAKIDALGALAAGDDASDVPTVTTNMGKYVLAAATDDDVQQALATLDQQMRQASEVSVPVTDMYPPDDDGICASQTPAGAGSLLLNGALVSGGEWKTSINNAYRGITIASEGDASNVNFQVSYYNVLGVLVTTGDIVGPNAATKNLVLAATRVVGITCDGVPGAAVKVGVGAPLVFGNAAQGPSLVIKEGAADLYLTIMPWVSKISGSNMASGKNSVLVVKILKDATARTVNLVAGGGFTLKTLGDAITTAGNSKWQRLLFEICPADSVIFVSDAGSEA